MDGISRYFVIVQVYWNQTEGSYRLVTIAFIHQRGQVFSRPSSSYNSCLSCLIKVVRLVTFNATCHSSCEPVFAVSPSVSQSLAVSRTHSFSPRLPFSIQLLRLHRRNCLSFWLIYSRGDRKAGFILKASISPLFPPYPQCHSSTSAPRSLHEMQKTMKDVNNNHVQLAVHT